MTIATWSELSKEAALRAKVDSTAGKLHVDTGFWGGVVPGNAGELAGLWEAGVLGFKCFLSPSGVDEFTHVSEADLRAAMPVLRELGAPLLVHAESPRVLEAAAAAVLADADPRVYATYLASRPAAAEVEAVEMLMGLVRELGTHVHVVHVSAAEALEPIHRARQELLPVTSETCPHYLHFAAEDGAIELDRFAGIVGETEIGVQNARHGVPPLGLNDWSISRSD